MGFYHANFGLKRAGKCVRLELFYAESKNSKMDRPGMDWHCLNIGFYSFVQGSVYKSNWLRSVAEISYSDLLFLGHSATRS